MGYAVQHLVSVLLADGVIEKSERDIYEYGLDLALYTFLSIGAIIVGGAIFGHATLVTGWILTFSLLQGYCGGYHAKTHARCFCVMVCAGTLAIVAWYYIPMAMYVPLTAISGIVIGIIAPVEHVNAPMSTNKKKRLTKNDRMLVAVLFLIALLIRSRLSILAAGISLGMISSAVSILYATISHKCLV